MDAPSFLGKTVTHILGRIDQLAQPPHQLRGVDEQKNLDALKDVRIAGQWQLRGQGAQALYGDVQAGIPDKKSIRLPAWRPVTGGGARRTEEISSCC